MEQPAEVEGAAPIGGADAPQTVPPADGYGAPQDPAAASCMPGAPPGGYAQMAGYEGGPQPVSAEGGAGGVPPENPYSGGGDSYGYGQQPMNPMYGMNQMMYGGPGQGGAQGDNMFYAQMGGGPGGPGMGGGNMFNANMMGMGMGGPMGMGMGYNPMGGDDKLAEQFGGMGFDEGGKGGGRGRGGKGGGPMGGFDGGMGKGKGKGFMHGPMGFGMDGRGRGKGGYPGGFEDRGKRDDERDRERARNGVRGLRSGGFGGMNPMGPPVHTPEVMRLKETINPDEFDIAPKYARFFIIKSYSEDDVHKSIKYGVWASTDTGNRRLDSAYRETGKKGPIYLFFSVNASGQFSGMAQMESALDYTKKFGVWAQDKWSGTFLLKWTFIKDIPNNQFRHILLANNENKPVTNSRDTQEVMLDQGREMLRIFHQFKSKTSILDDFGFYDKRQELMEQRSQMMQQGMGGGAPGMPAGGMGGMGMGVPSMLQQPMAPPMPAGMGGMGVPPPLGGGIDPMGGGAMPMGMGGASPLGGLQGGSPSSVGFPGAPAPTPGEYRSQ